MNLIQVFKKQIISYLTRSTSDCDSLIKFEINRNHDFGFQVSLEIWKNYFKIEESLADYRNNILIYAACDKNIDEEEAIDTLKKTSHAWIFKIDKLSIDKGICLFTLNRQEIFKMLLDLVDSDRYGKSQKGESLSISIKTQKVLNSSITQFRLDTISRVVINLLKFSSFILAYDPSFADVPLLLTTRSNLKADESDKDFKSIVCAVVCDKDEKSKKISRIEASNYLAQQRQNDMHLIAVHKFGVRVKNDEVT